MYTCDLIADGTTVDEDPRVNIYKKNVYGKTKKQCRVDAQHEFNLECTIWMVRLHSKGKNNTEKNTNYMNKK